MPLYSLLSHLARNIIYMLLLEFQVVVSNGVSILGAVISKGGLHQGSLQTGHAFLAVVTSMASAVTWWQEHQFVDCINTLGRDCFVGNVSVSFIV